MDDWGWAEDDVRRAPLLPVGQAEKRTLRGLLRRNELGHMDETVEALRASLNEGYLDPADREVLYGMTKERLKALSEQGKPLPGNLVQVYQRLKPQPARPPGLRA
ncbi:hypothetical protein GO986_20585 [Deinococcus sp. HMF7620]|uniref:Uncharacterized protein n=1 Tax=Deinococcus arboris TaxID=2682977 RepID=A0A7C9MBJ6_9DEIO|nr:MULTISPECIES: hypothetical protein [Deinococcus]MBZ9752260.1 hypothetical protein [Deinococcus betulae]MVN89139.1 hypothetical protein [Deinococcus arboris]